MMQRLVKLRLLFATLWLIAPSVALAQSDSSARVDVTLYPGWINVAQGSIVPIAVILDHSPGWHTHTNTPSLPADLEFMASTIVPTEVIVNAPQFDILTAQWPKPHEVMIAWVGREVPYQVFEGRAVVIVPLSVAADAELGPTTLNVTLKFQACDDAQCLRPATVSESLQLNIVGRDQGGTLDPTAREIFANYSPPAPPSPANADSVDDPESRGMTLIWIGLGVVLVLIVGGVIVARVVRT